MVLTEPLLTRLSRAADEEAPFVPRCGIWSAALSPRGIWPAAW
jgi:hypothetical protein